MSNIAQGLSSLDIMVFAIYVLIIIGVGLWVSRDKKGAQKSTEDYQLSRLFAKDVAPLGVLYNASR